MSKKTFVSTLFLLILAFQAEAQELSIQVGLKQELILKGLSCDQLIEEHDAICEWKKELRADFTARSLVTCKNKKIVVKECLPEFAKTYQQKKLVNHGPNCWGTAMSFKGISIKPRFMWPQEIQYWMNTPLCKKLLPSEEKKAGDIINVYGPEYTDIKSVLEIDAGSKFWNALFPGRFTMPYQEFESGYTGHHRLLHSVTYISPNLAFGKDSPSMEDPFYFHRMDEVYGRPQDKDCQENQEIEPYLREYQNPPKSIRGSKCDYLSVAYRCGKMSEYFANQNLTPDEQSILENALKLQAIQEKLFPLILKRTYLSQKEISEFKNTASIIVERALNDLEKINLTKNLEMLLTLEYFSAAGVLKSLEQAKL